MEAIVKPVIITQLAEIIGLCYQINYKPMKMPEDEKLPIVHLSFFGDLASVSLCVGYCTRVCIPIKRRAKLSDDNAEEALQKMIGTLRNVLEDKRCELKRLEQNESRSD